MQKISTAKMIVGCILLFHIALTLHSAYVMFSDFEGMTMAHAQPFAMLAFTLCWAGVVMKKRLFGLLYFSLVMTELVMRLLFGKFLYGDIFGSVFFPADILFVFVILILYKQIFGERSTAQNSKA